MLEERRKYETEVDKKRERQYKSKKWEETDAVFKIEKETMYNNFFILYGHFAFHFDKNEERLS